MFVTQRERNCLSATSQSKSAFGGRDKHSRPFWAHNPIDRDRVPLHKMAGTGSSSPFIKDEPDDQLFSSSHNQRFNGQAFNMPQQHFNQFGSVQGNGGSINPNDLTMPMSGSYMGGGFQNNFSSQQPSNPNANFSKGISALDDDDLLESLDPFQGQNQNQNQNGMQNGQNLNNLDDFDFNVPQNVYAAQNGISLDQQAHLNGVYSHTPEGDPIQSPFVHNNFNYQAFRQLQQQQQFGGSLQSPASFTGSPMAGADMHGSVDNSYMTAKGRARPSLSTMTRKGSNTRSPLTPKTPGIAMGNLDINGASAGSFPTQPIRTSHSHRHQKTPSGTWEQSASSMTSFPGSGFSSPMQAGVHPNPQISDILKTGSLPPKLNGSAPAMQTQEAKRRRRRESHNLVERRRRDNINERIQELSHLVPMHRLEDEKVRKALQNNSPLSPSLGATSMSPPLATSGLAPPGSSRAKPGGAGNITTGIPIEEKDKGPNKGDILNGAVSWTRDLMWMLHVKLQQQEELANIIINDLGGEFPFAPTEDEKRMQTELLDAMDKNGVSSFSYSRAPGTGLRVPKHTDVKGDPLGGNSSGTMDSTSLSPDNHSTGDAGQAGVGGVGQYWSGHNSGGSATGSMSFKEEDEYMDLGN